MQSIDSKDLDQFFPLTKVHRTLDPANKKSPLSSFKLVPGAQLVHIAEVLLLTVEISYNLVKVGLPIDLVKV